MRSKQLTVVAMLVITWLATDADRSHHPLATSVALGQRPRSARLANDDQQQEQKPRQLKREGTQLVNVVGRFQNEGDAATFVTKDGMEFGGLQNLSLERIIATLKSVEDPSGVWWSISGDVTEFSGKNYVLIHRAVFKAASPPPAPQAIAESK